MTNEQLQLFDEVLNKTEELYQIIKKIEDDNFAVLGIGIGRSERNEIQIYNSEDKLKDIEQIEERYQLNKEYRLIKELREHTKISRIIKNTEIITLIKRDIDIMQELEELRKENKSLKEQLNKE